VDSKHREKDNDPNGWRQSPERSYRKMEIWF
ncbi:unnamed protein product, partial [marine sediment metagenome]